MSSVDRIIDRGDCVFTHDWDTNSPGGGAGSEQVYCWKGEYAIASTDYGDSGPFDSLEEALQEQDLLLVTGATTSIDCTEIGTEDLAARLLFDDPPSSICINGERWIYNADEGRFERNRAAPGS